MLFGKYALTCWGETRKPLRMSYIKATFSWVRFVYTLMSRINLGLIAAGVAFYGILGVFPALAALIALWGIVGDPALILAQIDEYEALLPDEVEALLRAQLTTLSGADGLTLGWASALSFLITLWTARAGASALMSGLNTIYDVPDRGGVSHNVRALLLTLALLGIGVVALLCVVIVPVLLALFPPGGLTRLLVEATRWALAIGVLMAGFALVYRLGPNTGHRPLRILPGAMWATVLWAAASVGFSLYLSNFASYNEVYGSIGAVIAMLMWLFISAYLVLLGGALNAWWAEHEKPAPGREDAEGRGDEDRGGGDASGAAVHVGEDEAVDAGGHGRR